MIAALALGAAAVQAQTFKFANQGDALSMDPHSLNESFQLSFTGNVYEPLIARGKKLELVPAFLGVGVPPTTPSLGTLIRIGNEFLFSGEWWITIFPGLALILLVLSVNLLGDWLRDALNPKLR